MCGQPGWLRMNPMAPDTECERLVADLLAMMSAQEKRGQLNIRDVPSPDDREGLERLRSEIALGAVGGLRGIANREQADALQEAAHENSRLGIPLLFLTETGTGIDTIMPIPLSTASSWDFDAVEKAEAVIAQEARACGFNFAFAPRIALHANGGPVHGGHCGSEAHLAGGMAAARIRGLQSDMAHAAGLLSCIDLTDCLPDPNPQSAASFLRICDDATRKSRVGAIAYEASSPEQRSGTRRALSFLQGPGGFDGMILSQGEGPQSLDSDLAGIKRDGSSSFDNDALEDAAARVLRAKFRLGLLSAAHASGRIAPSAKLPTPVHNREAALDFAKRCAVLLRNEGRLLPLGIDSGEVLVVGSAASDRRTPLGGRGGLAASVIDGLEQLGIPHRFVPGLALRQGDGGHERVIAADDMAIGMACEAAKRAGTVIFVQAGTQENLLGEADRRLLSALLTANPRIVLITLGPVPMDPLVDRRVVPCILHAGQLGTMSGHAIAEVLSGEAAPSAKLPIAIPAVDGSDGLPFGHGLTYTEFALAGLTIDHDRNGVTVAVDLRNIGERDGVETVQLYLGRENADVQPMRLADFQRVRLRPGTCETLSFALGRDELGSFDQDGRFSVEAGEFRLFVGQNAAQGIAGRFELSEAMARTLASGGSGQRLPDQLRRA